MKVLSWDVGIINLSYCIIEELENKEGFTILQWGIINLMETPEMKKNRNLLFENIPKKLAELPFLLDVDKVVIENQPSLKNPQMKSIQMIVYSYFLMYGKVLNVNEQKIKDICFCNASNKLKVYKGPEIILKKRITKKELELEKELEKSKDIKIFLVKEDNNNVDENNNVNIDTIDTTDKINTIEIIEDKKSKKPVKVKAKKLTYTEKKKMAVEHVKYFLQEDDTNLNFFLNHKKKDDLADSYLQCLYILENK